MFQHFLRAFPLLREAFWIASGLLNVLGSFLDCFRLLLGPLDWFRLLLGFCTALDCLWAVGLQGCMSCGAADLWEAIGLPEKRCAHSYCIPARRACTSERFSTSMRAFLRDSALFVCIPTVFQHCLRAFPSHLNTLGWARWFGSFLGWSNTF